MKITKELLDKVYNDMIAELDNKKGLGQCRTFDEMEASIAKFGMEFERRVLEESANMQEDKKKRHAKTVIRKSKI